MNLNPILLFLVALAILISCARQSTPTGGPKDTIPPVLVEAIPRDQSINFKARQLQLTFSEDITLNSPKEQLIITPSIGKDYKITNRRKVVVIEFEQPLQDSTTYTFNFRESVQDLTEKNPVRNLKLAYSTGTYIDSLSIEGTVINLLTGKPVEEATVALHPPNDTFNIFEHPAVYFTKTDKQGKFSITNLKPDNYSIYAFQDKNRNLIVNSRTESYGFLAEEQYLLENIKDVEIGLIRLDAGPLRVTSTRPYNTYYNIRFSKNLRTYKLTPLDSVALVSAFAEDQANIKVYSASAPDSARIHLIALDSLDNAIDTTMYAKFLEREVTPEKFETQILTSSLMAATGQIKAELQFSKPIAKVTYDSIYFQVDSLTRIPFEPADLQWNHHQRKLTLRKNLDRTFFDNGEQNGSSRRPGRAQTTAPIAEPETKPAPIHELHLGTGALISVENDSSRQITQKLTALAENQLSVINMQIRTNEPHFIVQLLDNSNKVIREEIDKPRLRFTNIEPGDYQIRLIIDLNNNGRWDPGNYFTNTPPEPIVYYRGADGKTEIRGVKANWEIGTDGEMFITY